MEPELRQTDCSTRVVGLTTASDRQLASVSALPLAGNCTLLASDDRSKPQRVLRSGFPWALPSSSPTHFRHHYCIIILQYLCISFVNFGVNLRALTRYSEKQALLDSQRRG